MRGISRYNPEGYKDPTAHAALTKVMHEERHAAKADNIRTAKDKDTDDRTGNKEENKNGQKS